ncbi:hypothetical protein [Cellulophaga sp. L1A9]|uniref:hypothetical protein n=1 Tax=Cellulophaga sp. L1A9 TaxID=2686362 RepID=UPI00131B373B|nr:hypothetical protein [Cellulophaga sp. L1A9]
MNEFKVGDIVTFKTHPLLFNKRIKGDGKYVPPMLIISEVHIENKDKRMFDEASGNKISDRIKYNCFYFDDNKSEFKEVMMYEPMLNTFRDIIIERISRKGDVFDGAQSLHQEIDSYDIVKYEFGKLVRFKTKKIEIFKKRSSKEIPSKNNVIDKKEIKEIIQYVVNYSSPDFLISGYKKNDKENLFYPNGDIKQIVAENLLKVKWFNPFQLKFSEIYLPEIFFTDKMFFSSKEFESPSKIDS